MSVCEFAAILGGLSDDEGEQFGVFVDDARQVKTAASSTIETSRATSRAARPKAARRGG